jgi:hypothetical protein
MERYVMIGGSKEEREWRYFSYFYLAAGLHGERCDDRR